MSVDGSGVAGESLPGEDAYTAPQAARILGLSDRRVRQMLEAGELGGERDASGKWWIPQRAVHAALEDRGSPRTRSREQRRAASGAGDAGETPVPPQGVPGGPESVRELVQRVEDLSYRLGRSEARAELTERAERDAAREEACKAREDARAERTRADRLEAALRDALRPPRGRRPRARRKRRRGWR